MILYEQKVPTVFLMIISSALVLYAIALMQYVKASKKRNKVTPINVAGIELKVELATTTEEQILGLMYRDKLEDKGGMLFVSPKEQTLSFG